MNTLSTKPSSGPNRRKVFLWLSAVLVMIGVMVWCNRSGRGSTEIAGSAPQARGMQNHRTLHPDSAEGREGVRKLVRETSALVKQAAELSPDDIKEFQRLAEITNEFGSSLDERKAALLVKNMPSDFLATGLGDQALRYWAKADRATAAAWLAAHPVASPVASSAVVQGWLAEDPDGLRKYIGSLSGGMWKNNVVNAAGEEALVAGDPAKAIGLLSMEQGSDARREELYGWAVTKWGTTDCAAALDWIERSADPAQRQRLLAAANIGHANVDPAAGAASLVAMVQDPETLEAAAVSIARIWTAREPESAAQWVEGFSSGSCRDAAVAQLLEVWARRDWQGAVQWQASLKEPGLSGQAAEILKRMEPEMTH